MVYTQDQVDHFEEEKYHKDSTLKRRLIYTKCFNPVGSPCPLVGRTNNIIYFVPQVASG